MSVKKIVMAGLTLSYLAYTGAFCALENRADKLAAQGSGTKLFYSPKNVFFHNTGFVTFGKGKDAVLANYVGTMLSDGTPGFIEDGKVLQPENPQSYRYVGTIDKPGRVKKPSFFDRLALKYMKLTRNPEDKCAL